MEERLLHDRSASSAKLDFEPCADLVSIKTKAENETAARFGGRIRAVGDCRRPAGDSAPAVQFQRLLEMTRAIANEMQATKMGNVVVSLSMTSTPLAQATPRNAPRFRANVNH